MSTVSKTLAGCVVAILVVCVEVEATDYYRNDFQSAAGPLPEWGNRLTSVTPGTVEHPVDRFIGPFGNECATLTLTNLPPHEWINIDFDLYVICSWDGKNGSPDGGPDFWSLKAIDVNGIPGTSTLIRTTFTNNTPPANPTQYKQNYPEAFPNGNNPAQTGAAEVDTLGFCDDGTTTDSVYRFDDSHPRWQFVVNHASATLVLQFCAELPTVVDETWGIDNIVITNNPAVPAVSTWGVLILLIGVITTGTIVYRKRVSESAF